MDLSKEDPRQHGPSQRLVDSVARHRKALMLRVAYGAATATGTASVGLVVFLVRRSL